VVGDVISCIWKLSVGAVPEEQIEWNRSGNSNQIISVVKEGDEIERNRAENGIGAQSVSKSSRPCLA
jgi:hypothetical protein